jgi:hypothetical protein
MGRRPKPKKSKAQQSRESLAALLGIEAPKEEARIQQARTEEAVLAYINGPALFTKRNCKRCNSEFAVNRSNVSYCRPYCRIRALADLGITYRGRLDDETEQQWLFRVYGPQGEPLVVPPSALQAADAFLGVREQAVVNHSEQSETSSEDIVSTADKLLASFDGSNNDNVIVIETSQESTSFSEQVRSTDILDFSNLLDSVGDILKDNTD